MQAHIRPELASLAVPVSDVKPFRDNPNVGDVSTLSDSLTLNGQYRAILRWAATGEALLGNTTLAAAIALGWDTVAVRDIECDEQRARKIVAVDNRSADLGSYDDTALAAQLQALAESEGLLGTGYTDTDLDEILQRLTADAEGDGPAGSMDGTSGALREVSLAYESDDEREEFLEHVNRLATAWDTTAHSAQVVLRALELARV